MPSSHKRFFREKLPCYLQSITEKFIQRALFFNYAITFSQVQTDISINYCFCFCFYSFEKKSKSLYYAKASIVDLKGREREHIILEIPWNLSSFGRRNSINRQGSNLPSSSHDLSSKYAYNVVLISCHPY